MKWNIQLGALTLMALCSVATQAAVRISEVVVNPPDTDGPYEWIELRGNANESLANMYLIVIDGDGANRGVVDFVVDLDGTGTRTLGANGLLIIKASVGGHLIPSQTTVITDARLNAGANFLENGTSTYLLYTPNVGIGIPAEGTDYDSNNDGVLEGVLAPANITRIDAVGWSDGDAGDIVYTPANLPKPATATADAATRYPNDDRATTVASWYYGDIDPKKYPAGLTSASLDYTTVASDRSANFPPGGILTPGVPNEPNDTPLGGSGFQNTTPSLIAVINPQSGDVFDANPLIPLTLNGTVTSLAGTSSDQGAVPNARITFVGTFTHVAVSPIALGFNVWITLTPNNDLTRRRSFLYAASRAGAIAGGTMRLHMGASDASSAIAVSTDQAWVADDEYNALKRYKRDMSSNEIAFVDFSINLALGAGNQEVDQEASARYTASGGIERILWLGSHANDADPPHGDMPNRERIYATTLNTANQALTFGQYFSGLLSALSGFNSARYALGTSMASGVDPRAPDGSGLNIEGFALTGNSPPVGYIGFRAPLVPATPTRGSLALIAPINNIEAVVMANPVNSVTPSFNNGIELNLGGRGIRSIDRAGSSYLIVAGLPGSGHYNGNAWTPTNNAIFTWDGNTSTPGVTEWGVDLIGKNVEGIVEVPGGTIGTGTQFRVIEDNGTNDYYGNTFRAKDLPYPNYKKSRSFMVTLGRQFSVQYNYSLLANTSGDGTCCGSLSQYTWGQSEGFAINNSDTIAGISHGPQAQWLIGFIWNESPNPWNGANWQQLFSNGGKGYDVNENYLAVGYWLNGGYQEGIVWDYSSSTPTYTVLSPNIDIIPRGINDDNIVVGSYITTSEAPVNAFIWDGSGVFGLNALPNSFFGGSTPNQTIAHGINNRGQIVGSSGLSGGTILACVWEPNPAGYYEIINLPKLPAGGNNEAFAINDNGTIVGYSINSAGYRRACAWARVGSTYEVFDLGVLPGSPAERHSEAMAINNRGQIVGYCTIDAFGWKHAASWINGRAFNLNDRTTNRENDPMTGNSAWLTSANGINDNGKITGQVYRTGAISPCNSTCYKAYILWPIN